eukprot:472743_1
MRICTHNCVFGDFGQCGIDWDLAGLGDNTFMDFELPGDFGFAIQNGNNNENGIDLDMDMITNDQNNNNSNENEIDLELDMITSDQNKNNNISNNNNNSENNSNKDKVWMLISIQEIKFHIATQMMSDYQLNCNEY